MYAPGIFSAADGANTTGNFLINANSAASRSGLV